MGVGTGATEDEERGVEELDDKNRDEVGGTEELTGVEGVDDMNGDEVGGTEEGMEGLVGVEKLDDKNWEKVGGREELTGIEDGDGGISQSWTTFKHNSQIIPGKKHSQEYSSKLKSIKQSSRMSSPNSSHVSLLKKHLDSKRAQVSS